MAFLDSHSCFAAVSKKHQKGLTSPTWPGQAAACFVSAFAMFRALVRMRSCHEILGISPAASRQELKHRYHEMARSLHPDVASNASNVGGTGTGTASSASSAFTELRDAYEACLRLVGRPRRRSVSSSAKMTMAGNGNMGNKGSATNATATFKGFPTTPPHLRTTFPGAWTSNFRPKALNGGSYQGQPWKWQIRGPLTLSAQKKQTFGLRR